MGRKDSQGNQSKLEHEVRGVENDHLLQDRGTEEREDGEMKMLMYMAGEIRLE